MCSIFTLARFCVSHNSVAFFSGVYLRMPSRSCWSYTWNYTDDWTPLTYKFNICNYVLNNRNKFAANNHSYVAKSVRNLMFSSEISLENKRKPWKFRQSAGVPQRSCYFAHIFICDRNTLQTYIRTCKIVNKAHLHWSASRTYVLTSQS